MTQSELIKLAKEWLKNCPAPVSSPMYGFSGPIGFMCSDCFSRLAGRGCNTKLFCDTPVWDYDGFITCVTCGK